MARCYMAAALGMALLAEIAGGDALAAAQPVRQPPSGHEAATQLIRSSQGDLKAAMYRIFDLIEAGKLDEAERLISQAEAMNRATSDRNSQDRALILAAARGQMLVRAGAFNQAETLLKQVIVAVEARHGVASYNAWQPYATLGELYMRQARWGEAEVYLKKAVEVTEADAGKSNPATADMLNTLAIFYLRTGQYAKAEPILDRIVPVYARLGARGKSGVAAATLNLGAVYQYTGRPNEALAAFKRAMDLNTQVYGPDHPNTLLGVSNAGVLLGQLQRYDEALPLMQRSFLATRARYGDMALKTAQAGNSLAWIELGRRNFSDALAFFRPALALYLRQRDIEVRGAQSRGAAVDEREVSRTILGLMRAARGLADVDPKQADALADEAFVAAQRVHRGVAAQAFALASARLAAGDGPLSGLIRRRQDAARQWLEVEKSYTASLAAPARARDPALEKAARAALDSLQADIGSIDAEIAKSFPDYAALAEPAPLNLAQARAALGKDEVLVLFAAFGGSNGEDAFTFVVDSGGVGWRSDATGATALATMTQTLRCGLDAGQWDKEAARATCAKLVRAPTKDDPLPFSTDAAYKLFATLFGDLAPRLSGKTLYVVAPDPLASLPLQMLLTAPAQGDGAKPADLQKAAWLARSNALIVLPAASSLRRNVRAATAAAPEPFVGFGDPKLAGSIDCPMAEAQQQCPGDGVGKPALMASRGSTSLRLARRGATGLADLDAVRALCPLPETAVELRCVGQSLRAPPAAIHIGADATLATLRATPLDRYRVLHFATHGLLAGEIGEAGGAEPALVLTPPDTFKPNDDGLLRASEIAGLKLNADWVVLSACNTAAGARLGGESMSGLASAFFYAGARTLLASHWPVRSDAAVLLTTRAFDLLARQPDVGKAEAVRRAMVSLIDDPSLAYAHPSVWAPFAVAGEAGRAH